MVVPEILAMDLQLVVAEPAQLVVMVLLLVAAQVATAVQVSQLLFPAQQYIMQEAVVAARPTVPPPAAPVE
jgi:hypothetical protein